MKRYIPIIGLILTLLWMMVIFYFSSQTGDYVGGTSKAIADFVIDVFIGNKFDSFSIAKQEQIIKNVSYFIVKLAHFCEYGILCYFCFLLLIRLKKYKLRYIISILVCILYAISDEFHQMLSNGRTPRAWDVVIDLFGAIAMVLVIELFITIRNIIRTGKKDD